MDRIERKITQHKLNKNTIQIVEVIKKNGKTIGRNVTNVRV